MAENLPINFATPGEGAIASYNYSDIVNGLGYATFYAMTSSLSSGAEYILSPNAEYSDDIVILRQAAGTSTLTITSSEFNTPRYAKGNAIFSCGIGGNGTIMTVTAKVQKWDGASATDISSTITASSFDTTGGAAEKMILLQIPLTETNFKIGESLRIIVTFQTSNSSDGEIGIDPMGRAGTYIGTSGTTTMKVNVPFRINL